MLVPEWLAGAFTTSGFVNIEPRDEEEALILWSVFRSEIWKRQIFYLCITATQPEIRNHVFNEEMMIPWPTDEDMRQQIIQSARELLDAQVSGREAVNANERALRELFPLES